MELDFDQWLKMNRFPNEEEIKKENPEDYKEEWKEILDMYEEEKNYKPECSTCGDGGCIHCDPGFFYDGHVSY
jgi:hypothetical protein